MSQGDLKNPTMFGSFVSWQKAFNRTPAEQIALYRDPAFREAFRQELESREAQPHVGSDARAGGGPARAGGPRGPHARGDRGRARASAPVDAYFDLGLADDLDTRFQSSTFNFDPGGHRSAHRRRPLPDRPLRRRRPRRLHLRRRLRHRAARPLGAAARGAEPREGRAQADAGAGRPSSAFPTAACCGKARSPTSSLFDPATVTAKAPKYAYDLPCNGRRLVSSPRGSRRRSWRARSSTTTASTRARCPAGSSAATNSGSSNHRHPGRRGARDRSAPRRPVCFVTGS